MFENLTVQPDDPILQLLLDARDDPNPNTLDLSVGVYKDESHNTPVMGAIKEAEKRRLDQETTKTYMGIVGDPRFNESVTKLALGRNHPCLADGRTATLQTTGGSGAVRIAAELLNRVRPGSRIWVSDPTWGNHLPLLGGAGLQIQTYPYYQPGQMHINFDAMCDVIRREAKQGDIVLIHGGCHNPSGADLSVDEWAMITDLMLDRDLLPFVDTAYHGMADGLDQDAEGYRHMAEKVPEMLISYSGSKNFGLYRERTGALIALSSSAADTRKTLTNMMSIGRALYSMPPAHGAWVVAEVLSDKALFSRWESELKEVRERIVSMRQLFTDALEKYTESDRFEFIRHQNGLFSFLGITPEQVEVLKNQYSIYLLASSRINLAGLATDSIDYAAASIAAAIRG